VKRNYFIIFLILIASYLAITGCFPTGLDIPVSHSNVATPPAKLPTPTPFQPIPLTAEPIILTVWISPALPPELRTSLDPIMVDPGLPFEVVEDYASAQIRVEPNPEIPLTEWTYALVSPFPTISDGMTLDELKAIWLGSDVPILLSPATLSAVEPFFGAPGDGSVEIVVDEALLREAWERKPILGIVPFEALEPLWKVLELDGLSPIRSDFRQEGYPLGISFGLSGDPVAVEMLRMQLDWPGGNRDPDRMTVLMMTGVTALTRATAWRMEQRGITWPGELIRDWMRTADLAHVSNEVSFTEACPPPDPSPAIMRFCSSPENIGLLEDLGVDIVELTGNHNVDWNVDPYFYTLDLYEQKQMLTFAGGENLEEALKPTIVEHNGNKLGFMGCNAVGPSYALATETTPGAAPCTSDELWETVAILREAGVLPIVTFQWAEGTALLPAQREAFQSAVESGAIIVSGSQAHQPMGFEFYNDGFIHYGLGNLFFDQMQSDNHRREFLDRHVFYDGRHISTELLTAYLENYAQPRPMTAEERADLLGDIFKASGW
jgi:poly-gamma-glutamate synthesis protein (capsule biosynthesis protein)